MKLYFSQAVALRTSDKVNVKDNTDKWIDGQVIDAFAHAQLDKCTTVSYIPTTSTIFMIGDKYDQDIGISEESDNSIVLVYDEPLKDTVLLPYQKGEHWRLVVLKIARKARKLNFYRIDPMKFKKKAPQGTSEVKVKEKYLCDPYSTSPPLVANESHSITCQSMSGSWFTFGKADHTNRTVIYFQVSRLYLNCDNYY